MVSSSGVIIEIFEISCKYFSTACESRLVIWVAILSCLIIDNNNCGQMSLSGTNQRYNNANGGKVAQGKIKLCSAVYWHESNTQSPNFITFPKLKNIIFGKTNYLVI